MQIKLLFSIGPLLFVMEQYDSRTIVLKPVATKPIKHELLQKSNTYIETQIKNSNPDNFKTQYLTI